MVAGGWAAVVTVGIPNGTFDPNAGVDVLEFVFAPNPPNTGVGAGLLPKDVDVVAVPNAGGAAVVVVVLPPNEAPKLGTVVVVAMLLNEVFGTPKPEIDAVVTGVPNRFVGGAVCVVSVDATVLSAFAPNRFGVVKFEFVAPNVSGLADGGAAGVVVAAPKENALLDNDDVVTAGATAAGDGTPKERFVVVGAPKLKVGAIVFVVDVVDVAVAVDAAVVVALKLNDGVPNDGTAAGVADTVGLLPNKNVAIDWALVVGNAVGAGVAATPNEVFKFGLFDTVEAPKLNPPATGLDFAASVAGTAVTAAVETALAGVAGFPNENVGKTADGGIEFSDVFGACVTLGVASVLVAASDGDGVVAVAENENPPRRGTDSLVVTGFIVDAEVDAAVVAFNANEMVGFAGSPNDGRGVLFGNVFALFALDVAMMALGVDFVTSDDSGAGVVPVVSFFCVSDTVPANGKLSTEVVVAVLNVTVVFSPELNDAVPDAVTIGDSSTFALPDLVPLSTSS